MFLTQLLTLFQICRVCKGEKTLTEVNANGTMAEVVTICVNPQCGKRTTWCSQPNFPGTKIAAGNLLLSFGILVAGTSATKIFRVFQHMGMGCVALTTFFKYQRVSWRYCNYNLSKNSKFILFTQGVLQCIVACYVNINVC